MSKEKNGRSIEVDLQIPEMLTINAHFMVGDVEVYARDIIHSLPQEKALRYKDIENAIIVATGKTQDEVRNSKIVNSILSVLGFYSYRTSEGLNYYIHQYTTPSDMVAVLHKKGKGEQQLVPRSVYQNPSGSPHANELKNHQDWIILYEYSEADSL